MVLENFSLFPEFDCIDVKLVSCALRVVLSGKFLTAGPWIDEMLVQDP